MNRNFCFLHLSFNKKWAAHQHQPEHILSIATRKMCISKKQMVFLTKRIDINQDDNDILLTNELNRYKNNSVLLRLLKFL